MPTATSVLATVVATTLGRSLFLATTTHAFPLLPTTGTNLHHTGLIHRTTPFQPRAPALSAAGGNKKKRRRRKGPDRSTAPSPADDGAPPPPPLGDGDLPSPAGMFSPSQDGIVPVADVKSDLKGEAYLPDIRNVLKKKEQKKLDKENEELQKTARPKISRGDKAAFLQLLEAEPFADADDSFFVDEEYGTVSALLGEGALDFLGIPPGPLQVGHFIGALGIVLCAFVEYPGFPLTNLPTPLRGGLQGGLGTIYAINAALAVVAFSKAGERGQSGVLWAAKTFSVGGLAYDQLTQLPTLEEAKQQGIKR